MTRIGDLELVYHFNDGPHVAIKGQPGPGREFKVSCFNTSEYTLEHQSIIRPGQEVSGLKSYYVSWHIKVEHRAKVVFDYSLDLTGKRVVIAVASRALGDTLAWIPYVEAFQHEHKCKVICATHFVSLFEKAYPTIEFVPITASVQNVFAMYRVACWPPFNRSMTKRPWYQDSLQGIARGILGLDHVSELRPRVILPPEYERRRFKRVVCLGTMATSKFKEWNYPHGWDLLSKWLSSLGYTVINVSVESDPVAYALNVQDDEPLESIAAYIKHCDFFVGLSSGLSWLAWSFGVPVVMIAGATKPMHEFSEAIRVGPGTAICQGCFNEQMVDHANFEWCPHKKDFECTRSITPGDVKQAIFDRILKQKISGPVLGHES